MKNINDCLKQIASEYGLKYISYDNGKLVQLINRTGKSIAIYDHYFPLNSDTTAKICEDRGLCNKLLNLVNIKTDTNFEFVFSSMHRVIDDLSPLLEKFGEIIVKSKHKRNGFVQRISNTEQLLEFARGNFNSQTFLVNKFVDYEHFYTIYIINGIAELVCTYVKPKIVGDGQSAIWELLSRANIYTYDDTIDLNKVLPSGENLEISWKIKAPDSEIDTISDGETMQRLASLAITASRVVGLQTGTIDIYENDDELYVQSIDTSLNADLLLSTSAHKLKVKRLYEKAIKFLF